MAQPRLRRPLSVISLSVAGALVLLFFLYAHVSWTAAESVSEDLSDIRPVEVGLLLGTAPFLAGGGDNPFFTARLDRAAELHRTGAVQFILASGDNEHRSYNEPAAMREALMIRGVPESAIVLDNAGFSTLDSVARAALVFGLEEAVVISQRFHNERAVFLGQRFGILLQGLNANDVGGTSGLRIFVRELFARTKAVADVYFRASQPRVLGEPLGFPPVAPQVPNPDA